MFDLYIRRLLSKIKKSSILQNIFESNLFKNFLNNSKVKQTRLKHVYLNRTSSKANFFLNH